MPYPLTRLPAYPLTRLPAYTYPLTRFSPTRLQNATITNSGGTPRYTWPTASNRFSETKP